MDVLEIRQTEEALKYITEDMLERKLSDEALEKMADDLMIAGKIPDSDDNKWKIPSYYDNGLKKGQVEIIKGMLLSTDYNYKRFQKELEPEKNRIIADVENNTYKGRSLEDLEKLRLEAIDKINYSNDFIEKLQILDGYSDIINEGIEKLAKYKMVKEALIEDMSYDVMRRMLSLGYSVSKISEYLDADVLKVGEYAKKLGYKFTPEDEKNLNSKGDELEKSLAMVGEKPAAPPVYYGEGSPAVRVTKSLETGNTYPDFMKPDFSGDGFREPGSWNEMIDFVNDIIKTNESPVNIRSSKPLTPDMFGRDNDVIIYFEFHMTDYYVANTLFSVFMRCFYPNGCSAVTSRGSMVLSPKNKSGVLIIENACYVCKGSRVFLEKTE